MRLSLAFTSVVVDAHSFWPTQPSGECCAESYTAAGMQMERLSFDELPARQGTHLLPRYDRHDRAVTDIKLLNTIWHLLKSIFVLYFITHLCCIILFCRSTGSHMMPKQS